MPKPIRHVQHAAAPPELVDRLLRDIGAWRLWSPHVASTKPDRGEVQAGDVVATRAFFSPVATPMHVDWAREGEGMGWHSTALGHRLDYVNRVAPAPGAGATIEFTATVTGPAAGLVAAVARPFSLLGQRRRMARLAALAELVGRPPAAS
jgi:hypothetical protein